MLDFIEPHNEQWSIEFDSIKNLLQNLLHQFEIDIQHVGSTAIPNLIAKPILDIDIIIHNKADIKKIAELLEKVGYLNKGEQGISGRFAFRQQSATMPNSIDNKKWQTHHLYVCFSDSLGLKNHIFFRDALLNNKDLVAQYAQLKKHLAKAKGITRDIYTKQKTAFIISVLSSLGLEKNELEEIKKAND